MLKEMIITALIFGEAGIMVQQQHDGVEERYHHAIDTVLDNASLTQPQREHLLDSLYQQHAAYLMHSHGGC